MPPVKKIKLTEDEKQATQPFLFKYIKNEKKSNIESKINEERKSNDNINIILSLNYF